MADIVIRTDMPEYCYECPCHNGESGYCQAYKSGYLYSIERPAECPINPLPEGHGRLGDLDEIVKRLNEMEADFDKKGFHQGACWVHVIAELLRKAPTIVPPETTEEGDKMDG